MSMSIYRTRDKLLMYIESGDIKTLKDLVFRFDDGELVIGGKGIKRLKGNIEPELFEVLEEAVKKEKPLVVRFRIY